MAVTSVRNGISVTDQEQLWKSMVMGEREMAKHFAPAARPCFGQMESVFSSQAKFVDSLKDENDRFLTDLRWLQAPIFIDGSSYTLIVAHAFIRK